MSSTVYLSTQDVLARIPHKKTWLWAAVASGDFPEPLRVGGRCYWLPAQLEKYEAGLIAEAEARQAAKKAAQSAAA
jgi:predicted DNA-binding transcriptional regulator AlpA